MKILSTAGKDNAGLDGGAIYSMLWYPPSPACAKLRF
jgi:hypothetical protein